MAFDTRSETRREWQARMVENELNLPVKTKVAGIQKLIFSVDRARHSE